MVKNWLRRTPDNFRFTAKFLKIITHDKHIVDIDEEVDLFLNNIEPLQKKDTCSTYSTTSFNGNNARTGGSKTTYSSFG
jgi:uncharacterized protein YecE (DUF72 family)